MLFKDKPFLLEKLTEIKTASSCERSKALQKFKKLTIFFLRNYLARLVFTFGKILSIHEAEVLLGDDVQDVQLLLFLPSQEQVFLPYLPYCNQATYHSETAWA